MWELNIDTQKGTKVFAILVIDTQNGVEKAWVRGIVNSSIVDEGALVRTRFLQG